MTWLKVVFVARNPADCCVSFFHHERLVPKMGFSGSFDQYAKLFRYRTFILIYNSATFPNEPHHRAGQNPNGDYFYHLKSGWTLRNHSNLKFLWFEDMKRSLSKVIDELCTFLHVQMSEESKGLLENHLHIDNFRKNPAVNMEISYGKGNKEAGGFIRKGAVGGWRNYFSEVRPIIYYVFNYS